MKRHVLVLVLFSFFSFSLTAQTGPGGVGNTTTNQVWLKADDITGLNPNDALTGTWEDASGNGRHASQATPAYQPTYQNSGGIASLRFDGVNDYLDGMHNYTARTVFVVYNISSGLMLTSDLGQVWGNYGDGAHIALDARSGSPQGFSFDGFTTSGTTLKYGLDGDVFSGFASDADEPQFTYDQMQLISSEFATNKTLNRQVIGSLYPHFSIGEHQYGGDISEIIVYSTVLNSAQRIIIDNYLAAKYQINLVGNDYYAYQATHPYELAGVGRVDASNTHTVAMSAGALQVATGAGLDSNGEFLLFGHNGADGTAWTATEVPSANYERIAREWRFNETGEVGTATFTIDTATLNARSTGFSKFVLLVDADGDFSSGATVYTLDHVSGSTFSTDFNIANGSFVTIATFKPTVQFSLATSANMEDVGTDSILIELNEAMDIDVEVDYAVTGGTATNGGVDFTLTAGTATIPAGSTTAAIVFNVVDDSDLELTENFILELSNPVNAILGNQTTHTYSINDNDATYKVAFATASASGDESVPSVTVTITLDAADPSNDISVDYAVTGGTALGSGVDYTLASGTATILSGELTTTFDIAIVEDALYEDDETIIVSLSNPVNANLGTINTYTYTILNNDVAPEVSFVQSLSGGDESIGAVNLAVSLSAVSGLNTTINYTYSGTATFGVDYTVAGTSLVIPAGSTTGNIILWITNDSDEEPSETIIVTINTAINATSVSPYVHTFTIAESDVLGTGGPAGVGNQFSNTLWLKADDITGVANGGLLNVAWPDASGNNNHASQSNAASQPVYTANGVNGKPVVTFDGTNDYLDDNRTYNARTVFVVFRCNSATQSTAELAQLWGNYAEGVQVSIDPRTNPNGYSFDGGGTATARYAINNNTFGNAVDNGNNAPWSFNTWNVLTVEFTATHTLTRQVIGSLVPSFAVGAHEFGGSIAEIIVYSDTLGTTRRNIVQNYLAGKYNLTIANDIYSYEATHGHDIMGIGSNGTQSHFTANTPTSVLSVGAASDLGTGEYLLIGHNGEELEYNAITTPNINGISRLDREWRVAETGDVGTVDIAIDTTLLPAKPFGQPYYLLLVYNNASFTGNVAVHRMLPVGNRYIAMGIDVESGDYITIAAASNVSVASGSFNTGSNWASGSVPVSGQAAIVSEGQTLTLNNTTTVGSVLISSGATLNLGTYSLTVNAGDFSNSGILGAGTGTVVFAAGINQNVKSGSQAFHNLTMNGTGGVTLIDGLEITNTLTLTQGRITTGAHRVFVNNTAASAISGGSGSSFVNGMLRRAIASNNETYRFHVGNGIGSNNYHYADIANNLLGSVNYIDASFVPLANHNDADLSINVNDFEVENMSTVGVWRIDPNQQPTSGSYSFAGSITNFSGLVDNDYIIVKRPTGSISGADWTTDGGTFNTTSGYGRLLAHGEAVLMGLTTFSEFGFGQGDGGGGASLPIELLYFNAVMMSDQTVALNWATAIEIENEYFTIERSTDGIEFEEVLTQAGAGNSTQTLYYNAIDSEPLKGISYYRLKQTDRDGKFEYSEIVSVSQQNDVEVDIAVYPNPATTGGFTVSLGVKGFTADGTPDASLQVVNLLGEVVAAQPVSTYGDTKVSLPSHLAPGLYLLQLQVGATKTTKRLMLN